MTVHSFFGKYGGRDVINYANELKHKRAPQDIERTIFGKFYRNWPSSFAIPYGHTDTQTERHTHRQTDNPVFSDPNDPNTFSQ